MRNYFVHHSRLTEALSRHCVILGVSVAISVLVASVITLLLLGAKKRTAAAALRALGAVYAIPSLALFSLLIPVLGLGLQTAVFVLVLYNQFLLVRNFLAGLSAVDDAVVEAAVGIGMSPAQVLAKIKVPLAFPAIMAGIRLAVISTIGIGTIAAIINAGGIGALLFDGLRTMNMAKIIWGAILAAGLAIFANAALEAAERAVCKKLHCGEAA